MPKKLYFYYGVMGSAKSLDLIRAEYNYRERGLKTLVIVPEIDTRSFGKVYSRLGITLDARILAKSENIFDIVKAMVSDGEDIDIIFADEIHFFPTEHINQLSDIADFLDIPVLCYGLRSDFRGMLFETSRRVIELADEIQEIKAICSCGRKATFNARFINGEAVKHGEQIFIGDEEYKSFCRKCYKELFYNSN